ncbi:MAG: AAA domain-containing protein, partial [Thermodesulfobacteriota bacterium]
MQKIIKKYLDRLHESLNRSALLSAFPPKRSTSRLDLHRLSCLDKDLPTEFLELLIYSKNASIPLQFKYDELIELSKEIERLKENQEPVPEELIQKIENLKQIATLHAIFAKKLTRESDLIYRETGLRSLWLGYPLAYLTVPSTARKPKKILAPIFLWPIKIKTNLAKQGEVTVSRDIDSGTPIYNKAFDLWCTKYLGVNPDDPHKDDLVEISKADMQNLINEIFKGFSNPPRLIDEYGIKPIPTRDTLSREAGNQKILNSAILGVIKWENQAVMSNLEELLKFRDYPIITTGILGGDFNDKHFEDEQIIEEGESTRYHVCKTDHWQQSAIIRSRYKPGIIIHGPPGTGKSETITNIVADSLARGERVLVVCQKRAAIDVVYERIKKAGLESLCIIVHDSNSDRKRVIESLKGHIEGDLVSSQKSLNISDKRQILSIEIVEIEKILDDYSKALYAQEDSLKISYRDARLSYLKVRERWKGLRENKTLCDKLSDIDDVTLKKLKYKVREIGKLFYEADPENNPWKWRKRDFALSRHLKND